jgi:hypothetical protein
MPFALAAIWRRQPGPAIIGLVSIRSNMYCLPAEADGNGGGTHAVSGHGLFYI